MACSVPCVPCFYDLVSTEQRSRKTAKRMGADISGASQLVAPGATMLTPLHMSKRKAGEADSSGASQSVAPGAKQSRASNSGASQPAAPGAKQSRAMTDSPSSRSAGHAQPDTHNAGQSQGGTRTTPAGAPPHTVTVPRGRHPRAYAVLRERNDNRSISLRFRVTSKLSLIHISEPTRPY